LAIIDNRTAVICWGKNTYGELGLGDREIRSTPTLIPYFKDNLVLSVFAGCDNSMVLLRNGSIFGFGYNRMGELGVEENRSVYYIIPQKVDFGCNRVKVKKVVLCNLFTLFILRNDRVLACGYNEFGQLGIGTISFSTRFPTNVPFFEHHKIDYITHGARHCLAMLKDGQMAAWGYNKHGELGFNQGEEVESSPRIVDLFPGRKIKKLIARGNDSMALLEDGNVYTWGETEPYSVYVSFHPDKYKEVEEHEILEVIPKHILSYSTPIQQIFLGRQYVFFIEKDESFMGYGDNYFGQLTFKHGTSYISPSRISFLQQRNYFDYFKSKRSISFAILFTRNPQTSPELIEYIFHLL